MLDNCWQVGFPFHYCNKRIFSDIVSDIFNGVSGDEILEKYKIVRRLTNEEIKKFNCSPVYDVNCK